MFIVNKIKEQRIVCTSISYMYNKLERKQKINGIHERDKDIGESK